MKRMNRALSKTLFVKTWRFIANNKDLFCLSWLAALPIVAAYVWLYTKYPLFFNKLITLNRGQGETLATYFPGNMFVIDILLLLFLANLLIFFVNSWITACVAMRFRGETGALGTGLARVLRSLFHLLEWAVVGVIIDLLLSLLENSHNAVETILYYFLGVLWSLMSFFVVPAIIIEGMGPIAALKQLRQAFVDRGKRPYRACSFELFYIPCYILITLIPIAALILAVPNWHQLFTPHALIILFLASSLCISPLLRTASVIFKTALYLYFIKHEVPKFFCEVDLAPCIVNRE